MSSPVMPVDIDIHSQILLQNLAAVRADIAATAKACGRNPLQITLLAASKAQPVEFIRILAEHGEQFAFGENYAQEAIKKIAALHSGDAHACPPYEWHFIGPIQANKTRLIAENFAWVHGIDRTKIAERLNAQRPPNLPPLNVCIEINQSRDPQKSGIRLEELFWLMQAVQNLPRLKLRGLMTMISRDYQAVGEAFRELRAAGHLLDTLSMGMSGDYQQAIVAGSTLVRIGTALFGQREHQHEYAQRT